LPKFDFGKRGFPRSERGFQVLLLGIEIVVAKVVW